jgi:AAA15 family ATPase/GTPase
MLVSFSVANWMSYRDEIAFSMIASKERQHASRVPAVDRYRIKVLPIAAIYGGNASGKTNFFKALNFVRKLVVKGTEPDGPIPVQPFRLDATMAKQPSRFRIELLADEVIYEFSFSVTREAVLEEKLVAITSADEKLLYHRQEGKINFGKTLKSKKSDPRKQFAFMGTRDNQLFLTNSVSQKINDFRPVYDWFKDTLKLIAPDSRFGSFERLLDDSDELYSYVNELLPQLDTGIVHLGTQRLSLENASLPEGIKTKLQEELREGEAVRVLSHAPAGDRFVVTRENGELIVKKLVTYHTKEDGTEIKFEFRHESDGSRRVIELLPAFTDLSTKGSKRVYVIDEIDRSLHTLLTRKLLEAYLARCSPKSRTQLLMTTHDVLQMDQHLLRRDEMWIAERDVTGSSNLISFGEYKDVRYDKDIRKSYLQGRLGGIPRIFLEVN